MSTHLILLSFVLKLNTFILIHTDTFAIIMSFQKFPLTNVAYSYIDMTKSFMYFLTILTEVEKYFFLFNKK